MTVQERRSPVTLTVATCKQKAFGTELFATKTVNPTRIICNRARIICNETAFQDFETGLFATSSQENGRFLNR